MNTKWERFKNTLYYYKPYLVIGALVLATLIVGFWVTGPKAPDGDLNVAVIGETFYVPQETKEALKQAFQEKIQYDCDEDGQKIVYVDLLTGLDQNTEGRQRLDMEVAVGPSRLMILDQVSAQAYATENLMTDLSAYAQEHGLKQSENPYMLSLKADSFLSQYFKTEGLVACLKVIRLDEEDNQQVLQEYRNAYAMLDLICE